jgi:guanylate kinase
MDGNKKNQPGVLLVISGPSGVGKTTITRQVEARLNGEFSVSYTTRPKSPNDRDGIDYHFIDREKFIQLRDAGQLLEWAEVFTNFYGTPRAPVDKALSEGRLMILEIDVEGALNVKKILPQAFSMFVLPPTEEKLIERLRARAREGEDVIQRRFAKAKEEIARAKASDVYDVFIVNDSLPVAVERAVGLVKGKLCLQALTQ